MIAPGYQLRGLLVAAVLACTTLSAWSGDVKVAFINPNGPPEFWQLVCTTMKVAAAELGIDVEIRDSDHSRDKAIAIAKDFLAEYQPPDHLIATNDVDAGGEVVKLADAAHVKTILQNNDLDECHGESRTRYRDWLGKLAEAAEKLTNRPLKILALAGEATTPASIERVRGLKRGIKVMLGLLGSNSVCTILPKGMCACNSRWARSISRLRDALPRSARWTGAESTLLDLAKPSIQLSRATTFLRTLYWASSRPSVKRGADDLVS